MEIQMKLVEISLNIRNLEFRKDQVGGSPSKK